jgi:hypothetical protein
MAAEEQAVHAMFLHRAIRGEWFRLEAGDLEKIAIRRLGSKLEKISRRAKK